MKKTDIQFIIILVILFVVGVPFTSQAQVGIGTELPHASAQLEIAAEGKGILIPRMAEADRPVSPATGLLIYQTDNQTGFYYYTGTAWEKLGAGTGTSGPSGGGGTIIPFSSGASITMTTALGGLAGTVATLGFGNSTSGISLSGSNIDLTISPTMAFSVPRNGIITSLSGFFSFSNGVSLTGTSVDISVQLYQAPAGSSQFTPIPDAKVTIGTAGGIITPGQALEDITTGLNIPVAAGSRLLLVFSSQASGVSLSTSVQGYASAGVTIN